VVVQARNDRLARGVEHLLAVVRLQVADFDDPLLDPNVGRGAVEQQRPLNQHDANRLSASSRSTAALSAPSSVAGTENSGFVAQRVSVVRSSLT